MSVQEDSAGAGNDSFWEVAQYKRTVDRQENGGKLCDELTKLIRDRANIEKEYANKLKNFSKAWNERIDKGSSWNEYGTTASAWKGVLTEADQMAEIHLRIKEKLIEEVESAIARWKKESYKKSAIGPCKETKMLDDEFKKAQKPWEKRLTKVKKCRKEYHTSCKNEKSALNQESNARADSGLSVDQKKKIEDKVEKSQREVETSKDKYETALADLNAYNAKYMEDMTEVFNKSQEFEKHRLDFFKEMLFGIHRCLDISKSSEIPHIYEQYDSTISQADSDKDLKWWSMSHGVDMPMNWPQFEEYSPDFHTISRKEKKQAGSDGVTMTGMKINQNAPPTYNDYSNGVQNHQQQQQQPLPPPSSSSRKSVITRKDSYDPHLNPFEDEDELEEHDCHGDNTPLVVRSHHSTTSLSNRSASPQPKSSGGSEKLGTSTSQPDLSPPSKPERTFKYKPLKHSKNGDPHSSDKNPFGEDDNEWGGDNEYDNPLADDGAEGVPVRALYDYEGAEEDELTFKTGEVFVKLADRDDQGWCKGRVNGRVGLYPDNYVEEIKG